VAQAAPPEKAQPDAAVQRGRGLVTIENGRLMRDCEPWYPRGMSLFGRLIPRGWKSDRGTMTAQEEFGPRVLDSLQWLGVDVVRFQVGMPFLDPKSPAYKASYLDELRDAVRLTRDRGFSVMLSMQWQERTKVEPVEKMPAQSALRAWKVLGPAFADDQGVMYELFNEPISGREPTDAQWSQWQRGHQALIDEVRGQGAGNVLIVDGLNQGKILQGAPALSDPLNRLAYGIHPRLWGYLNAPAEWNQRFGRFADKHVVIATEWSHGDKFCRYADGKTVNEFLAWLEKKNIGLVAWGVDMPRQELLRRQGGRYVLSTFDGKACNAPGGGPGESIKALFERTAPTPSARHRVMTGGRCLAP